MSAAVQLDLLEALRRRNAGMARVLHHSDDDYREALSSAIRELAASGDEFTADAARIVAGDPPKTCSPNVTGALFNAASKSGLIEAVGFGRSGRVIGNGNRVLIWRGRRS